MIVFKTGLNSQTSKQLNKFNFKKIFWVFILISVLCIAVGILGLVAGEDAEDRDVGIGLIIYGVLFAPLVWFITRLAQRHYDKSAAYISDDTVQTFKFDEERLYVEQERGDMFKSDLTAVYSYCYKVKESSTYYFIYVSSNQVLAVPKADIVEGDIDELDRIFSEKLGKKYKSLRKK